jgi:hypothetical protein
LTVARLHGAALTAKQGILGERAGVTEERDTVSKLEDAWEKDGQRETDRFDEQEANTMVKHDGQTDLVL